VLGLLDESASLVAKSEGVERQFRNNVNHGKHVEEEELEHDEVMCVASDHSCISGLYDHWEI
jgi:hypothetical protein